MSGRAHALVHAQHAHAHALSGRAHALLFMRHVAPAPRRTHVRAWICARAARAHAQLAGIRGGVRRAALRACRREGITRVSTRVSRERLDDCAG
eukprot:364228-Chlamydomonas_euryale.AAC.6